MIALAATPPEIDADGFACVESIHDDRVWQYLHDGIRIAAWPSADGGVILNLIGGTLDDPRFEGDAALCRLSPDQLTALIANLSAVRAALPDGDLDSPAGRLDMARATLRNGCEGRIPLRTAIRAALDFIELSAAERAAMRGDAEPAGAAG